jgi:cytochrome c biogenesis protein CcmG/thiol:disulfide interchange protein DsbE
MLKPRGVALVLSLLLLLVLVPASQSTSVTDSTPRWQVWPEIVNEDNTTHLIWIERENVWNGETDLKYSRSTDGENWSSPVRLNYVQGKVLTRYHQEHPTIAVDGDELRVFWLSKAMIPYQIRSIYSSDAGQTWNMGGFTYDLVDEEHVTDFLTAQFDAQGGLHLVWQDVRGHTAQRPMKLVSSADGGETWTSPATIDPFNTGHVEDPEGGYSCECCRHTIVPSSDGGVDVIYRQVDRFPSNETWYMYTGFIDWDENNQPTAATRIGNIWVTENRICPETGPQLVATEDGLAAVWNSAGVMYLAFDNGTGFGEEIPLGPGGNPSLDSDEEVLQLAWHDSNNIVHAAILHPNGTLDELFTGGGESERYATISNGMLAYQKYVSQNWEMMAEDLRDSFAQGAPPPGGGNNSSGNNSGSGNGSSELDYDHFCDDVGVNCIYVENDRFQPASLTVQPGESVVFVWMEDASNHNVAQVAGPYNDSWNGGFRSGDPVSGPYNWSLPATALASDATIQYVCEPHSPMMRGRIVVGNGDPYPTASVGGLAPDFTLQNADGVVFTLSDLRGEVVVLDLMATWCPNCEQIAQQTLIPMQADLDSGTLDGVTILSVGTDRAESNEMLGGMSAAMGYHWSHSIDTEDAKVGEKYGSTVPTVVVIDVDGTVTFLRVGYVTTEELRGHVDSLVGVIPEEPEPEPEPDEDKYWGLPGFSAIFAAGAIFMAALATRRSRRV